MTKFAAICLMSLAVAALPAGAILAQGNGPSVQQALDRPLAIKLAIPNAPIGEVFERISAASGVKFIVDDDTLAFLPYGDQTRLSVTLENITLRKALTPMLAPQALRWTVEEDAVRILPTEALYRMCRRATYDELRTLGVIHSQRLAPTAEGQSVVQQLRKAAGSEELDLFFHVPAEKEAVLARAERALPGTAARWLDMLCHGKGWTWHLWGDDIVVLDRVNQIERQLACQVSLRHENAELATVLLDLARQARVKLMMAPGVMNYLPQQTRDSFNIMMTDATIAEALEVISGATGLEFARTGGGIRVEASESLKKAAWRVQEPKRRRSAFFVKMNLPGPDGTTVEVFIRSEELPSDVVEAIQAEKKKLIEHLRSGAAKDSG